MKATHSVKVNGVWYTAGSEIPAATEITAKEPEKVEADYTEAPKVKRYTRTEIRQMNAAELRRVATENGIEGADNFTGSELKEMLLAKM